MEGAVSGFEWNKWGKDYTESGPERTPQLNRIERSLSNPRDFTLRFRNRGFT